MKQRLQYAKKGLLSLTALFALSSSVLAADPMTSINIQSQKKVTEAQVSQKKIDAIVEDSQKRLIEYRALLKQIDGLKAYNLQLQTQVANQDDLIKRFEGSISQVALIERQMVPLVTKMATALDDFFSLDLPFLTEERQTRLAFIQENLSSGDINVSEKFRQVIEAYQIESEYGRKIETYSDIITIDGERYEVDVLRVGRIAIISQTKDTKITARYNMQSNTWEKLDNATYRNPIRKGIKMAKKQEPIHILTLPINAPTKAAKEGAL